MSFPWYEVIESRSALNQGDLIKSCPVLIPPNVIEVGTSPDVLVVSYNVIVLSQSCDLVNGHIDKVFVAHYMTFRDLVNGLQNEQRTKRNIESLFKKLKGGLQPNYHLLDKDNTKGLEDYLVVDFRNVFSVDLEFLRQHANNQGDRVRLRPPYREQLSQAFAKFFMRVGLPQDIPDISGNDYLQ